MAKEGKLSNIQYLIEKEGVDVNKKTENDKYNEPHAVYDDCTALHIACFNGFLPIVQYLIAK